jgi:hypothetical protein
MRSFVALLLIAGCGSADPRLEQIRSKLLTSGETPSDEIIANIIAETEAKYGDAAEDENGYPLYSRRPFELPEQEWSWTAETPYTVQPEGSKSAPLVEHRYVQLHYPAETDPTVIADAGKRVWHHFANEVQKRHPQAHYKMVSVGIFVEDQTDARVVAGRVFNDAAKDFPDEPRIEWEEWNAPKLEFQK